MKIVILNGEPAKGKTTGMNAALDKIEKTLTKAGHEVEQFILRDMDIKYCIGCFGCWVKTPGRCVIKDDAYIPYKPIMNSDLLIYASPVKMKFISSLLKRMMDRMIPLIHPYMSIRDGEMHHTERYDKSPVIGVVLGDATPDDMEFIERYFKRTALNFFTRVGFVLNVDNAVKEVENAVNNI
ncbi:MAG: flavodoxin family protein [Acidobacteria bacterium]|nr:flavodoxin family protein [Acidobacteriota bacterium]